MVLYCKIGTMPGLHMKAVSPWPHFRALRKPPVIGQFFAFKDPRDKWAKPIGVRLLEIRDVGEPLYVCERF